MSHGDDKWTRTLALVEGLIGGSPTIQVSGYSLSSFKQPFDLRLPTHAITTAMRTGRLTVTHDRLDIYKYTTAADPLMTLVH